MAKIDRFLATMVQKGAPILRLDPGDPPLLEFAGGHRQLLPGSELLGTVLGMMDVLLAAHRAAPLVSMADLTGGLWAALSSTALSLVVAILVYAGYNLLVSRVESILLDMERSASALVNFMRQWKRNRETPK